MLATLPSWEMEEGVCSCVRPRVNGFCSVAEEIRDEFQRKPWEEEKECHS